jgi:hypothetical protein
VAPEVAAGRAADPHATVLVGPLDLKEGSLLWLIFIDHDSTVACPAVAEATSAPSVCFQPIADIGLFQASM